jgi:hypothetical protein
MASAQAEQHMGLAQYGKSAEVCVTVRCVQQHSLQ